MKGSKKTLLFIILVGLIQSLTSQVRVATDFNSVISGRSINVLASGQLKNRHEFGGGLRININKYTHNDDQNNFFKKRMYATKPLHYFGIEGFYQVHIFQKLKYIDLFAFYDIQLSYSTTGNRFNPFYDEMLHFGPFTWIEQNIGIGFTVDIWNNIFFIQRLGGGVNFILGEDKKNDHYLMKTPFTNEFGYLLSAGIGYRFNPKKEVTSYYR
jgi:hypothetical protein